jgi:hypothetical protein
MFAEPILAVNDKSIDWPHGKASPPQAGSLQPLRLVVANAGASPGRQHAYERPSALTQMPPVPAPPPPGRRKAEATAREPPGSPMGADQALKPSSSPLVMYCCYHMKYKLLSSSSACIEVSCPC